MSSGPSSAMQLYTVRKKRPTVADILVLNMKPFSVFIKIAIQLSLTSIVVNSFGVQTSPSFFWSSAMKSVFKNILLSRNPDLQSLSRRHSCSQLSSTNPNRIPAKAFFKKCFQNSFAPASISTSDSRPFIHVRHFGMKDLLAHSHVWKNRKPAFFYLRAVVPKISIARSIFFCQYINFRSSILLFS